MIILGLTGGIGMGKSTAARQLRRLGIPVHDADAAVHRLLAPGGAAVALVERAFPGVTRAGGVDRQRLGAAVFADPARLAQLESLLHPLVREETGRFLRRARRHRRRLVVLDIPLLFETGAERRVDGVVLVGCPSFLQAQRVLARPGMTAAKLAAIRRRQMSEPEKRRRADYFIPSGAGLRVSLRGWRVLLDQSFVSRRKSYA